jgi:hypothetical protein
MKTIKYSVILFFWLVFVTSCSKFDDINTNPNVPTTVTSGMLATQLLKNSYRFWNPNPTDFGTGNLWTKHIAILETNPNPYQYYYSYWPYGDFGSMSNIPELNKMVEFSKDSPLEASYRGLALFLKASYGYSMTLDMGDVPYSEAGKANEGISRPKYDKQADVFAQILNDLKAAEEQFAKGKDFDGDIMYGGDVTKWRKLCNAMQLQILQLLSKKITAEQKARFSAIVAAGNLMTGNSDNFQLQYSDNPNSSHPFWGGENRRINIAVSKTTVDVLKRWNDRRLFYFAEPAQTLVTAGKSESDFDAYQGAPTELSAETLTNGKENGLYSLLNKRYPLLRAGDPMFRFTYAEQCFILAEAVEENWIAGSAKDYFEKGVKAILSFYMTLPSATAANLHGMAIDQNYINNYFTGEAAYKESASKAERIKQIITQRWLLDFFQGNSGFSYRTFLRTGYPEFPLDPNTSMNPDNKTVYPKRWKYPTNEQTTNPVNYQKAIDEQYGGYDGINGIPWWLK